MPIAPKRIYGDAKKAPAGFVPNRLGVFYNPETGELWQPSVDAFEAPRTGAKARFSYRTLKRLGGDS